MARTLAGQVAVVTGASSGIGWALGRALAAEGCRVGLVARRAERLDELASLIGQAGGTAAVAAADVSRRDEIQAAIAAIAGRLGPVDLLVANAGVGMPTLLDPVNIADVEAMFRVNVLGVVYSIEAVLPAMLRRGRGHIAAVSSLGALKGLPGESAYCASKAAVNTYLEGLRIHVRDRGLAVTTLCPGFVRTPMTAPNQFPMPWCLEPDDAARRIVRALRRRRKVAEFPLPMALLMRLIARLPDWAVALAMRGYNEDPPMPEPADSSSSPSGTA